MTNEKTHINQNQKQSIITGLDEFGKEKFLEMFITGELYLERIHLEEIYRGDTLVAPTSQDNPNKELFESLKGLGTEELVNIIYLRDFEVTQPITYKEGDWVRMRQGDVLQLDKKEMSYFQSREGFFTIHERDIECFATEKEVKKEKRVIWWSKNNRCTWELRAGDILKNYKGDLFEVGVISRSNKQSYTPHDSSRLIFTNGKEEDYEPFLMEEHPNLLSIFEHNYRVVSFKENRED